MNEKSQSQEIQEALRYAKSTEAEAKDNVSQSMRHLRVLVGPDVAKAVMEVALAVGVLGSATDLKLRVERQIAHLAEMEKLRNKMEPRSRST